MKRASKLSWGDLWRMMGQPFGLGISREYP